MVKENKMPPSDNNYSLGHKDNLIADVLINAWNFEVLIFVEGEKLR